MTDEEILEEILRAIRLHGIEQVTLPHYIVEDRHMLATIAERIDEHLKAPRDPDGQGENAP